MARRLIELTLVEMADTDSGPMKCKPRRAWVEPQRSVEMSSATSKSQEKVRIQPLQNHLRHELGLRAMVLSINSLQHVDIFAEVHQRAGRKSDRLGIVGTAVERTPGQLGAPQACRLLFRIVPRAPDFCERQKAAIASAGP